MTRPSMDELSAHHLNTVLRLLLTAVHQQFIHVLLLRNWGDAEAERRIRMVDRADFPTALRMIDRLVADGAIPDLCPDGGSFAAYLPAPGASRGGILAAELALERRLLVAAEAAREALPGGGSGEAETLLADALAPRRPQIAWLEGHGRSGSATGAGPPVRPFGGATASLVVLLGWLIVAVEQGLVSAFALWHAGAGEAAEAAWAASGAAMRQATALVELFADRGIAPAPAGSACPSSVDAPRASRDAGEAARLGRALAGRCHEAATTAAERAAGTEAAPLCREIAAFHRDARDRPFGQEHGVARPSAAFPSFAAMHRKHVGRLKDAAPIPGSPGREGTDSSYPTLA